MIGINKCRETAYIKKKGKDSCCDSVPVSDENINQLTKVRICGPPIIFKNVIFSKFGKMIGTSQIWLTRFSEKRFLTLGMLPNQKQCEPSGPPLIIYYLRKFTIIRNHKHF